jgi:hypothetical protein
LGGKTKEAEMGEVYEKHTQNFSQKTLREETTLKIMG